jgi:iron complex outermembrane receptor protein
MRLGDKVMPQGKDCDIVHLNRHAPTRGRARGVTTAPAASVAVAAESAISRSRTLQAGLLALLMGTSAAPLLVLSASKSWAAGEIVFDIPAGDLGGVLAQIGRIGAQPISFPADLTRGRRAGPIVGRMGVQAALARALAGTGLVIVPGPAGALKVSASSAPAPAAVAGDIAAIDVVDTNAGSPYGDRGFQAGAAGDTLRIADAPLKETPVSVSVVTNEVLRS